MGTSVRKTARVFAFGVTLVAGGVGPALAVDGVVLIDQARALAGNVTPGDAPGFPVTISKAGSYRLSGNLTVPDKDTTAVRIAADDVTLDLNGFAILGPNVCSGTPTVCGALGNGKGVDGEGQRGTAVFNGTVRGMGFAAVRVRTGGLIEKLRVKSNGEGIFAGDRSTVTGNVIEGNNGRGIVVLDGCTVSGNTVTNSGTVGIRADEGSVVLGNTVRDHDGWGLILGLTTGYGHNVLSNQTIPVEGGTSLGQNLCNGVIC